MQLAELRYIIHVYTYIYRLVGTICSSRNVCFLCFLDLLRIVTVSVEFAEVG